MDLSDYVLRLRQGILPMPGQCGQIPFRRRYTGAEWRAITQGVVPLAFDDRWFIYLDGRSLFFHRSWSGICVYQVLFQRVRGGWEAREAIVNQNSDQYPQYDLSKESAWLEWIIDELMLRRYGSLPCDKPDLQGDSI